MQLLHLEGSIKSLTMQSIRMDSRGRQVTESLLQEERIKSFDREFNIIDRRILKSANMSVETAAADFDLSKRLTSPAMPQRIASPKCVPRDSRRPPIRRHSLQDSIPTTPIHALVAELEQELKMKGLELAPWLWAAGPASRRHLPAPAGGDYQGPRPWPFQAGAAGFAPWPSSCPPR